MVVNSPQLDDDFAGKLPAGMAHIGLAVSGGSDSIALLRLAAKIKQENKTDTQFSVFCVDHQLRKNSACDADFVMSLCQELGIPGYVLIWSGKKPSSGIQDAARNARYGLMVEKCREIGADALVTAHTQDDQAETFLMRLKRGAGLDGLSAMSLVSEFDGYPILRPLLGVSRKKLRSFLAEHNQEWIDDPSNENTDFERVRLRRNMRNWEAMGFGASQLSQSAARLLRARSAINAQVDEQLPQCVTWFETGCCQINNRKFSALHDEIALRILSRILFGVGGSEREPQLQKIERAYEVWQDDSSGIGFTLSGCRVVKRKDNTLIVREGARQSNLSEGSYFSISLGEKLVWDRRFVCEMSPIEDEPITNQQSHGFHIRPLGKAGWQLARDHCKNVDQMPSYMAQALVSLWRDETLICVPHIGFNHESVRFNAHFMPRGMSELPLLKAYSSI